ncbi:hypothetical protein [Capnocytophaga canimorsus]|uniref:hypothetical protein n=1 Tax=Capnocytophaga canimorsus TaxID=28188 RepID=UPI0028F12153|nr:hypothetical protein [Capnocytophaga canimorsus]MDT9499520.1 hypothetical protein [Capnocytophaga canimorsus]
MCKEFKANFTKEELSLIIKQLKDSSKHMFAEDLWNRINGQIEYIKIQNIVNFLYQYSKILQEESAFDQQKGISVRYVPMFNNISDEVLQEYLLYSKGYESLSERIEKLENIIIKKLSE